VGESPTEHGDLSQCPLLHGYGSTRALLGFVHVPGGRGEVWTCSGGAYGLALVRDRGSYREVGAGRGHEGTFGYRRDEAIAVAIEGLNDLLLTPRIADSFPYGGDAPGECRVTDRLAWPEEGI